MDLHIAECTRCPWAVVVVYVVLGMNRTGILMHYVLAGYISGVDSQ